MKSIDIFILHIHRVVPALTHEQLKTVKIICSVILTVYIHHIMLSKTVVILCY